MCGRSRCAIAGPSGQYAISPGVTTARASGLALHRHRHVEIDLLAPGHRRRRESAAPRRSPCAVGVSSSSASSVSEPKSKRMRGIVLRVFMPQRQAGCGRPSNATIGYAAAITAALTWTRRITARSDGACSICNRRSGVVAIIAFAWVISENRRAVSWKQAGIGLAVTFAAALLLLKVPPVTAAFARHQRRGRRDRRGDPRRHLVRVRLSRRRPAAVRAESRRAPNSSWRSRRCRSCW